MDYSMFMKKGKPYAGVVFLQFGCAGFVLVAKAALNKGSSHYTFSVYRNAIAAAIFLPFAFVLERKVRPRMTLSVFLKIMLLSLLDPIIGQNLYYGGMSNTTATFAAALCNILPSLAFLMAWILRVEKVNLKDVRSHAKLAGTVITLGGAMLMTLVSGPVIGLPWTHKPHHHQNFNGNPNDHQQSIQGALMITASNFGYALFYIVQAITLKSYPAGLTLTALICTLGALQGTVLTFVMEKGNDAIWGLAWDVKLLAYVYGGIISSGITYYISGIIMKEKGPVFVTAFSPLNMVIVAALSSFIFSEQMSVGKLSGALVIVAGLYLVVWGKSKDQEQQIELIQNQTDDHLPTTKIAADDDASHRIQAHHCV